MIFDWFINRKKRASERKRRAGFDWAAGELLRGVAYSVVVQYAQTAHAFGDYDEYDEGAEEALRMFRALCEKITSVEQGMQHIAQWCLEMAETLDATRDVPMWGDLEAIGGICRDTLDTLGTLK